MKAAWKVLAAMLIFCWAAQQRTYALEESSTNQISQESDRINRLTDVLNNVDTNKINKLFNCAVELYTNDGEEPIDLTNDISHKLTQFVHLVGSQNHIKLLCDTTLRGGILPIPYRVKLTAEELNAQHFKIQQDHIGIDNSSKYAIIDDLEARKTVPQESQEDTWNRIEVRDQAIEAALEPLFEMRLNSRNYDLKKQQEELRAQQAVRQAQFDMALRNAQVTALK